MTRLEKSSGFKGNRGDREQGRQPRARWSRTRRTITDPHAWQSLANGKVYVANIRDALIAADPDGKATYEANAQKFLDGIARMETTVKDGDRQAARPIAARSSPPMTPSAISARPTAWSSSRPRA